MWDIEFWIEFWIVFSIGNSTQLQKIFYKEKLVRRWVRTWAKTTTHTIGGKCSMSWILWRWFLKNLDLRLKCKRYWNLSNLCHWKIQYKFNLLDIEFTLGPTAHATIVYLLRKILWLIVLFICHGEISWTIVPHHVLSIVGRLLMRKGALRRVCNV